MMSERLRRFLENPPAGSKTRAAMDFGIDLSLTVRNMFELTAEQRFERIQNELAAARKRREQPDS